MHICTHLFTIFPCFPVKKALFGGKNLLFVKTATRWEQDANEQNCTMRNAQSYRNMTVQKWIVVVRKAKLHNAQCAKQRK